MTGPDDAEHRAPMLVIRGEASDEEVAALLAVLQGLAAARRAPSKRPRRVWSAPHRAVGGPAAGGPRGGGGGAGRRGGATPARRGGPRWLAVERAAALSRIPVTARCAAG